MRSTLSMLSLAAAIAGVMPAAHAQNSAAKQKYWDGDKNGWHFYETKPAKPKLPEPEPEPKPEPQIIVQAPPAEPAEPPALSTAWLRANFEKYQERAIDDPTPTNVALVGYLQRLSVDRAERYSQAMQQMVIDNPNLDEFARSAITTAQRMEAEKTITAAKQQTLAYLSQRFGIWYFYSSTCPYCRKQEPILDRFEQRAGFSIFPVSLDGGPLPSGSGRPFVRNNGHAERLGVLTTPTLVVADTTTGQLFNLAAGLRTTSEIEDRLLQLAKSNNWISEAQYDEAVRGEPRQYLTDGLVNTAEIGDDPEALLEALKRASYNGGSSPWRVAPQPQQ